MPNKTQEYLNLAQQTAKELTRYWENWTDYLTTASRLYKYSYQGEYSRERLILRLRTVHPKTIIRLAQNDTGNVADRHMKQILSIYNGAGRTHNLPCKR